MHFLEKFILYPSSEHLLLLKYLLILIFLIHLSFIGIIMGGSLLSVIFNLLGKKKQNQIYLNFASDLINTVAVNKSVGLILGILPLLIITLIYSQILYTLNLPTVNFLLYSLILVSLGFIMLYVYKDTFHKRDTNFIFHIFHGILGILLIYGAYFIFFSSLNLILAPEEWAFIKNPLQLVFYLSGIIRYLFFIISSMAITGGWILFFFFHWPEKNLKIEFGESISPDSSPPAGGDRGKGEQTIMFHPHPDPLPSRGREKAVESLPIFRRGIDIENSYKRFVKNFSLVLALTATLLQPSLILWNLILLPETALSANVFTCYAILLFLLLLISYILYAMLKNSEIKFNIHVFGLFIFTFLIVIISDQVSSGNAIKEHTLLLTYKADELRNELNLRRMAGIAGETEVSEKKGEFIFNRICSQCHRFDRRLVGPPLDIVLPKYENKKEDLEAFIQSPAKKNPGYPPMPKLGLKEEEIVSVTKYILKRIKIESPSP